MREIKKTLQNQKMFEIEMLLSVRITLKDTFKYFINFSISFRIIFHSSFLKIQYTFASEYLETVSMNKIRSDYEC